MQNPERLREVLSRLNPEQQQSLLSIVEKKTGRVNPALRLFMARQQGLSSATSGAQERSALAKRNKGLDDPLSPEFQALREKGQMEGTAAAGLPALGILGAGAAAGMVPAGLLPGLAKDAALGIGAEVAERALGLPSWVGQSVGVASGGATWSPSPAGGMC